MIERNIYFTKRVPYEPIRVVEGATGQKVLLHVMDVDISTYRYSTAYVKTPMGNFQKACNLKYSGGDNAVELTIEAGLFYEGECELVIEIYYASQYIYSYAIPVICEHNYFGDTVQGDNVKSVVSAMVRAETAASRAAEDARNEVIEGMPSFGISDISGIGDGTLTGAVNSLGSSKLDKGFIKLVKISSTTHGNIVINAGETVTMYLTAVDGYKLIGLACEYYNGLSNYFASIDSYESANNRYRVHIRSFDSVNRTISHWDITWAFVKAEAVE